MKFHVCDSLTGQIVGRLYPNAWSFTDPVAAPGTGTLTVPLPNDAAAVARLVDLTAPRRRWVAIEDDQGRIIFGGPIPRRPARSGGEVTISLIDWRGWFYWAVLRPHLFPASVRGYIKTGVYAINLGEGMAALMRLALNSNFSPPMITVDDAPSGGVVGEITAMALDRSVGETLDSITARGKGTEWYTYIAKGFDVTKLTPHVAVCAPERASRTTPIRVEYRIGRGGNAHEYSWPEGQDAPTRVWALGDGEPPAQAYAYDEYHEIDSGSDVLWERLIGPLDGVTQNATAFGYASKAIAASRGLGGEATFSILDEKLAIGDVATGDRAHILIEDGWDSADIAAARIIERTVSGGRNKPTMQTITVDLADAKYPYVGIPGVAAS
jgi:hypothetical protein